MKITSGHTKSYISMKNQKKIKYMYPRYPSWPYLVKKKSKILTHDVVPTYFSEKQKCCNSGRFSLWL